MKNHPNPTFSGTVLALVVFGTSLFSLTIRAENFVVTNLNDQGPGSLRENLVLAGLGEDHLITFAAAIDGGTITLQTGNLFAVVGQNNTLRIDASALNTGIEIDAGDASTHLRLIGDDGSVILKKLSFLRGNAPDGGGNSGGSINASGNLTLFDCRFEGNRAGDGTEGQPIGGDGGAIFVQGDFSADGCVFEDNRAGEGFDSADGPGGDGGKGGALFVVGACVIQDSEFALNRAGNGGFSTADGVEGADGGSGGYGGAVLSQEEDTLVRWCWFRENHAGTGGIQTGDQDGGVGGGGGAFYGGIGMTVRDCVFVGNQAGSGGLASEARNGNGGSGGAVSYFGGPLALHSSVFVGNRAGSKGLGIFGDPGIDGMGGAIASIPFFGVGDFLMEQCIIAENRETAVVVSNRVASIASCTIAGNTDKDAGDAALTVLVGGVVDLEYCLIGGNLAGPFDKVANIDEADGATLNETGLNSDLDVIPVDLSPSPFGESPAQPSLDYGVPLPGIDGIVDQVPAPANGNQLGDIRNYSRVTGSGMDLGAIEAYYFPDNMIGKRRHPASYRGDNFVSASGANQTINVKINGRRKTRVFLLAQNEGDLDNLSLRSGIGSRDFKVRVFQLTGGKKNVTAAVKRNGSIMKHLGRGQAVLHYVDVKPKKRYSGRIRKTFSFDLRSANRNVAPDRANLKLRARAGN